MGYLDLVTVQQSASDVADLHTSATISSLLLLINETLLGGEARCKVEAEALLRVLLAIDLP
jgi:hypothetical protein